MREQIVRGRSKSFINSYLRGGVAEISQMGSFRCFAPRCVSLRWPALSRQRLLGVVFPWLRRNLMTSPAAFWH